MGWGECLVACVRDGACRSPGFPSTAPCKEELAVVWMLPLSVHKGDPTRIRTGGGCGGWPLNCGCAQARICCACRCVSRQRRASIWRRNGARNEPEWRWKIGGGRTLGRGHVPVLWRACEVQIWNVESVVMVLVKPGIGCAYCGGTPQGCPPRQGVKCQLRTLFSAKLPPEHAANAAAPSPVFWSGVQVLRGNFAGTLVAFMLVVYRVDCVHIWHHLPPASG